MLYDELEDATAEPTALRTRYERALAAVVESVGVGTAARETAVGEDRLRALVAGESPDLTVDEAASILACSGDEPDAETVRAEIEDRLLLSMTTAVLDADAVSAGIEGDLTGAELRRRVEGRTAMALDEYARVRRFIASRRR